VHETYPGGDPGVFNMAVMGLRLAQRQPTGCRSSCTVHVSRDMFDGLWPGFDHEEVPITSSITNGVHAPTWVDRRMASRWLDAQLGTDDLERDQVWEQVHNVSTGTPCGRSSASCASNSSSRPAAGPARPGWSVARAAAELGWTDDILDPDVLTIGFARRVPTYKRLTLMLRDPARLKRILLDPTRPVQFVIAGKSHPADETGKKLIQQMVRFADDPAVRHRIVFLPNYDIEMAQVLYPGCDVWLNNPLRPFEACGTSGMKAALNGGLNLSILDGWWDEWYDGQNGWAIPTADGVLDPDRRDDIEAAALYDLIENSVRVHFYDQNENGLPLHWAGMLVHTMQTLGPKVQATRMVRDYVTQLYAPAARAGVALDGPKYVGARDLAAYKAKVRAAWPSVRVEHVESSGVSDSPQVGDTLTVRAYVDLGTLRPDEVRVQAVYGPASDRDDVIRDATVVKLRHTESYEGDRHQFAGTITLARTGSFGYSVRVLPRHKGLAWSSELGLVANA
jgi:starch phosphorylase